MARRFFSLPSTAPALADELGILADLATGAPSTVDLAPYAPDRAALTTPTGEVSWLA